MFGDLKFLIRSIHIVFSMATICTAAETCSTLSGLKLPATTLNVAETITTGTFALPQGKPLLNLPDICRVAGVIRPTRASEIGFEVWMPAKGWNGRFLGVGNGGYAGAIDYASMASAVRRGYASAGTDTGHKGPGHDAGWALRQPEKLIDFGHRAIHETAEKAKAVIAAYFGKRPDYSFFAACSTGGRQGLMEAQRYPADYDGIVSGAPALEYTGLMLEFAANAKALSATPESHIPAAKLPAIEHAVLAQCDAADGLADGIVSDPARCSFDPSVLRCRNAESDSCLTQPQIAALMQIYAGLLGDKRIRFTAGFTPGAETGTGGWGRWILGEGSDPALQETYGTQFMRNIVLADPDWKLQNFESRGALNGMDQSVAAAIDASNPDLSKFAAHGGKLIIFHGWSDAAVPPLGSIRYFQAVWDATPDPESFVRLYMVPGMKHCGGGPGPNSFSSPGEDNQNTQSGVFNALEKWVVGKEKPGPIVARKYAGDDPRGQVIRSRPICPYPQLAVPTGAGSIDDAASFVCKAP